jgi:hypothetical protein
MTISNAMDTNALILVRSSSADSILISCFCVFDVYVIKPFILHRYSSM